MLKYLPLIKQNFKISKEDKQKENKFFEKHYRATEEIYKNSIDFNFNKNWNGKGFYEVQCRSSTFEKLKSKGGSNRKTSKRKTSKRKTPSTKRKTPSFIKRKPSSSIKRKSILKRKNKKGKKTIKRKMVSFYL